jgi:DNA segregation ATPase FtsK/SpoIIIE-like protein
VASKNATSNKNKTTNTGKKAGRPKKAPVVQEEVQEDTGFIRAEVGIIVSFALAVILFLSNFHLCGALGDVLRSVQLGLFGFVGFLAPLLIFVGTTFYVSNRGNFSAMRKLIASIVLTFVICGFAQLFFGASSEDGTGLIAAYQASSVHGGGGGLIGALLCLGLRSILGNVGAFIVLAVLFVICAVCITEKSVVKAVKKRSDSVYQHAKEDIEFRRELNEEKRAIREEERAVRAEERRRQREERIRGVNISSTDLSMDNMMDGEIAAVEPVAASADTQKKSAADVMREAAQAVKKMTEKPAADVDKTQPVDQADIFTGSISMPPEYEDPDEAPFEENVKISPAESAQRLVEEGMSQYQNMEEVFLDPTRPLAMAEDLSGIREIPVDRDNGAQTDAAYVRSPEKSMQPESELPWEEEPKTAPVASQNTYAETTMLMDPVPMVETQEPVRTVEPITPIATSPEEESAFRSATSGYAQHDSFMDAAESVAYQPEITVFPAGEQEDIDTEPDTADLSAIPEIPVNQMEYEMLPDPDPDAAAPGTSSSYVSLTSERVAGDVPEEIDHVKKTSKDGVFYVPGGEKRVETATGKIIDTDTEALQKKLESARREAKEATGEAQVADVIKEKEEIPKREYVFPPLSLLQKGARPASSHSEQEYRETAIKLQQTLKTFGVGVTVTNISCGPTVTRYELHPEMGVKVSKIVGLADDIKLSLAAADIRIEAPIPGKSAVGIEVPNKENSMVHLRDLLEAENFKNHSSTLAFAVGKDIGGQVVVTDIAKMPHLLIAGQTGSGKSVCINTLIMSIIYKSRPEDVKLILVDPKVVELSIYNGIPHLLIPVVTDPKKAAGALNWAVAEMTDRYKKFAQYGVRDIKGFNAKVDSIKDIEDDKKPQKMPKIVIIIDELADLMMVASNEVEDAICRLAQLARACGIHLVIATQRPSVNVITGLIKANVPSRIAFSVASGIDSRTIIDMYGAEKLLGHGDMLFYPAGYPKPQRVQGAFVSDEEVQAVCDFLNDQGMTAQFNSEIEKQMAAAPAVAAAGASGGAKDGRDEYFADAGRFIIEKEKASIGMLQRVFKIGFNRAARIMDQLADAGVVGEEEGTKPRKVLMTMEEFETFLSLGD